VAVAVSLRSVKDGQGRTLIAKNDRDVRGLTYLRQSQRHDTKFRGLLEAAPDAMVIILVDAQAENLFGYIPEQLRGAPVDILVPERFRDRPPTYRTGYFNNPKPRPMGRGFDFYGRRRDGSEFPAGISLSPMETDEGVCATPAIRDITDREQAEFKFRGLLESAPDGMVIVNHQREIVLTDAQTENLPSAVCGPATPASDASQQADHGGSSSWH
jgi:PAS domain S-box-containing protein